MRSRHLLLALVLAGGGCRTGSDPKQSADASTADTQMASPDSVASMRDVTGNPDQANVGPDTRASGPDVLADVTGQGEPDVPSTQGDTSKEVVGADVARDVAQDMPADPVKSDSGSTGGSSGHVSVLQHHNNATRDGFYVDSALSKSAIAKLHVDTTFAGATVSGPTYAQPLYLAGAAGDPDLVIVATEQNHVYAFDAATGGKAVWDMSLGTPLPKSRLATLRNGCGNIDPLGITGTPVIDAATRTIYLDAMTIASTNATAQHQVFALDASTGAIKSGWPVDLNSTAMSGSTTFDSLAENQRGALILLDSKVFVPFGGHIGDCGVYHGWIVGVSTTDPTKVSAWASRAIAGGVWAPGGISSDGQSLIFATGNTENQSNTFSAPPTWQDGETIFRLPSSLAFSGQNADYFTPTNWAALDNADTDIGGTAPIVVNVPGATPSSLVVGLGKDGNAYLLDRGNFGGIGSPLTLASVATGSIINASAAYTTPNGTYVVFKGAGKSCPSGQSGGLVAFKIGAASPPTASLAWCGGPTTQDSPAVSATDDGGTDAVVWIVGSDNKLYGLDGDTGKSVFAGGTSTDTMSSVQKFETPIVANGRVFVAANNQVYAFTPN
jgi:outer membrane protein assembly factor BamB